VKRTITVEINLPEVQVAELFTDPRCATSSRKADRRHIGCSASVIPDVESEASQPTIPKT